MESAPNMKPTSMGFNHFFCCYTKCMRCCCGYLNDFKLNNNKCMLHHCNYSCFWRYSHCTAGSVHLNLETSTLKQEAIDCTFLHFRSETGNSQLQFSEVIHFIDCPSRIYRTRTIDKTFYRINTHRDKLIHARVHPRNLCSWAIKWCKVKVVYFSIESLCVHTRF